MGCDSLQVSDAISQSNDHPRHHLLRIWSYCNSQICILEYDHDMMACKVLDAFETVSLRAKEVQVTCGAMMIRGVSGRGSAASQGVGNDRGGSRRMRGSARGRWAGGASRTRGERVVRIPRGSPSRHNDLLKPRTWSIDLTVERPLHRNNRASTCALNIYFRGSYERAPWHISAIFFCSENECKPILTVNRGDHADTYENIQQNKFFLVELRPFFVPFCAVYATAVIA